MARFVVLLSWSMVAFTVHGGTARAEDAGLSFHVVEPKGGLTFYAGTLNYVTVRVSNLRDRSFVAEESRFEAVLHVPEQTVRGAPEERRRFLPEHSMAGRPDEAITIPARGAIELPVLVTSQTRSDMARGLCIAVGFTARERHDPATRAQDGDWGFLEFVPVTLAEATSAQKEQDFGTWRRTLYSDKGLNHWAVRAAALIETEETIRLVYGEYIRASDSTDRSWWALALAHMKLPLAGRLALDCLRDPDEMIRIRIMEWLGENHRSLVPEAAQGALRDSSPSVRSSAVRALARADAAADLLLDVLTTSDDTDVRKEAAWALYPIATGTLPVERILSAIRCERDPEVRSTLLSVCGVATKYTGIPRTVAVSGKPPTAESTWMVYGAIGFLAGALGLGLVLLVRGLRRTPGNRSGGAPWDQITAILLWMAFVTLVPVPGSAGASREGGVSLAIHLPEGGLYLDGVANYVDVELGNGTEQEILAELWVTDAGIREMIKKEPSLSQWALKPGQKGVVTALVAPSLQCLKEGPEVSSLPVLAAVAWRAASENHADAQRRLAMLVRHFRWTPRAASPGEKLRAVEALRSAVDRARGKGAPGLGEYMQAIRAAGMISHESARLLLHEQYQADAGDERMRLLCIRSIVRCSRGPGVEALVPYLKDPSAEVRREILVELLHQEDPRLSDVSRLLLRDADASVRALATTYLKVGGEQDASLLRSIATSDPDPTVRARATSALLYSAPLPPESELMRIATSYPDPSARMSAVRALRRSAHPPSESDFLRLLKAEPDKEVRSLLWVMAGEEVLRLAPEPVGQPLPQPRVGLAAKQGGSSGQPSAHYLTRLAANPAVAALGGAIAGGLLMALSYWMLAKRRRRIRG